MKTGACYIRVSTDDQGELSPDTQLLEIQKYAKQHGIILNKEFVFVDEGISGKKAKNRPAFQEMIGTAKKKPKPFDVILLWKFSRFARNQEEAIVYKGLLRKDCGIEVISITEPIDDNPFGSLIERIIEWFDGYYSIRLGEDVKRSMTEKARRGEFQTGAPYGYIKKKDHPLAIYEPEAHHVRFMFERFASGSSYFAIAKDLNSKNIRTKKGNKWENRTIEYIINNPMYIGYVRWTPTGQTVGKRIYDDPNTITEKSDHPTIIDMDTWEKCQEILKQRKANKKKYERPAETKKHWIVGLLRCGTCGSTLSYTAASNGFQCISYAKGVCPRSHFIGLNKIEKLVFDALEELGSDTEYLENIKTVTDNDDTIAAMQNDITRFEAMLQRAKTAYVEGFDTLEEYGENKKRITAEIKQLKSTQEELSRESKPDTPQIQKHIKSTVELLKNPDIAHETKYNAIRDIVEKITFKRPEEEVKIYLYRRA